MRTAICTLAAIALVGCSKPADRAKSMAYADAAADAQLVKPPAPAAAPAPPPPDAPAAGVQNPSAPILAYSYGYAIEAPASRIRGLIAHDEALCAAAGPLVCQVTGSSVQEVTPDNLTANLAVRAIPRWATMFKTALATAARDAHGRLTKSEVTSEDLSRQIIDGEATLRAKTALRDRLQAALESRPGKTADLVEIAKALSDVQGEIDTANSELAAMKQRVAMSDIKIEYDSAGVLAPSGVWSPLGMAARGFLGTVATTVGVMITLLAVIAPWGIVLAALWWLARRLKIKAPRWKRPVGTPNGSPPP